jgi:hypothetical protein
MAAVKPGQRILLTDLPVEVLLDHILPFGSILGVLRLGCTNKVRGNGLRQTLTITSAASFSLRCVMMMLFGNASCWRTLISLGKVPLVPVAIN